MKIENNWTTINEKQIFKYLTDCLYLLSTGPATQTNKKGRKLVSDGKKNKWPIINTIFGSLNGDPFNPLIDKYVSKRNQILLVGKKSSNVFHKINNDAIFNTLKRIQINEVNIQHTQGDGLYNWSTGKASGFSQICDNQDITIEIQLLLRFFRYIKKGNSYNMFIKWYIRKNEMYFWLKETNKPRDHIITELDTCKCGS